MLIGLISDTHVRTPGYRSSLSQLWTPRLPSQVKEAFRGVDLILHAGDVYTVDVLDDLERIAPILVSEGDDDPFEIMNDKRVKLKHVLSVEGVTIWLTHEYEMLSLGGYDKPPDVIVFGHAHRAILENSGDVIQINPGTPTFPEYKHELGTVGLLTVNSGKVNAQIIQLQGEIGGMAPYGLQR